MAKKDLWEEARRLRWLGWSLRRIAVELDVAVFGQHLDAQRGAAEAGRAASKRRIAAGT